MRCHENSFILQLNNANRNEEKISQREPDVSNFAVETDDISVYTVGNDPRRNTTLHFIGYTLFIKWIFKTSINIASDMK